MCELPLLSKFSLCFSHREIYQDRKQRPGTAVEALKKRVTVSREEEYGHGNLKKEHWFMPPAIKHLLMIAGVLWCVFWVFVFCKEENPEAVKSSSQV